MDWFPLLLLAAEVESSDTDIGDLCVEDLFVVTLLMLCLTDIDLAGELAIDLSYVAPPGKGRPGEARPLYERKAFHNLYLEYRLGKASDFRACFSLNSLEFDNLWDHLLARSGPEAIDPLMRPRNLGGDFSVRENSRRRKRRTKWTDPRNRIFILSVSFSIYLSLPLPPSLSPIYIYIIYMYTLSLTNAHTLSFVSLPVCLLSLSSLSYYPSLSSRSLSISLTHIQSAVSFSSSP